MSGNSPEPYEVAAETSAIGRVKSFRLLIAVDMTHTMPYPANMASADTAACSHSRASSN